MRGALLAILLTLALGGGSTTDAAGARGELAASPPGSADPADLPNLVPLPAHSLQVGPADDGDGRALRFAVTTVNFGEHPFDILPVAVDAEMAVAHQCVRWSAPRVCTERREVGHLMWHVGHHHFHLEDFAAFELRRVDEDLRPVPGPAGLVSASRKLGFCLAELVRHHDTGPLYRAPYYVACAGTLGYQGLSPGWQDTYSPARSGQQLVIDDVPDGTYAVLVTIDPDGLLHETTAEDNTSIQLVELLAGTVTPIEAP